VKCTAYETGEGMGIAARSKGIRAGAEIRFVHHRFGGLAKASITGVCHYADDHSIGSENIQVLAQRAPIREELAGYSRADYYYRPTLHSVLFGQRAAREKRYPHGFEETGADLVDTETLRCDR
jgi:hypothetical protein